MSGLSCGISMIRTAWISPTATLLPGCGPSIHRTCATDSLRHHDTRLDLAGVARGLRFTRCDHAGRQGVPRRRRSTTADVCPARRAEFAVGVPTVDRCGGGTTPQRCRRPTDRLLAAG